MQDPLWVFGYGSLIWNPEFAVAERQIAQASGWARRFCMYSVHYRGTPQQPGLVLALSQETGALCNGVALRVEPGLEAETLALLRARELVSSAYLERSLPLRLQDGRKIEAVAYVIDPDHVQYCPPLSLEAQAQIIATAEGERGPNRDYLFHTAQYLNTLGIIDPALEALEARVRQLCHSAKMPSQSET